MTLGGLIGREREPRSCSATTSNACATSPPRASQMAYLDPPFNTGSGSHPGARSPQTADVNGDRTGFGGRRYAHAAAGGVLLPRRVRRLPRLPRAATARGAAAAAPHRHAVLPHRLARGALLQAAARRAVRAPRASSTQGSRRQSDLGPQVVPRLAPSPQRPLGAADHRLVHGWSQRDQARTNAVGPTSGGS